jgi:membrane fusion protein, heavy metal efflux system
MTTPASENPTPKPTPPAPAPSPPAAKEPHRSTWERISLGVQLAVSLLLAGGVFAYLLWSDSNRGEKEKRPERPDETVQVIAPGLIRVKAGTALDGKLDQGARIQERDLTTPILPVTGTALASLRPGAVVSQDSWQFATPELLTAFADWQKSVTDVEFQESQGKLIAEMNNKRVEAQEKVVARLKKLTDLGTDSLKDLAVEQTNLIQFEIQKRKEIYEAQIALKLAQRNEATLSRQLQQAGLAPAMLRSAAAQGDIVVAEVPETMVRFVKLGMKCEVRFFALPDRRPPFTGKVSGMAPVISKDKRVLNVQFIVEDPDNAIRPGMFAEIGLGIDKRKALLMPADGVLHVGDKDYALLKTGEGTWKIEEVLVGELNGTDIEVLPGTPHRWRAGEAVMGQGAILLKPVVVRALQQHPVMVSDKRGGGQP